MEENEKKILLKKSKKAKDPRRKSDIKKLIQRIDQRANSRKERTEIRNKIAEMKKAERQKQVETGKKAYFTREVINATTTNPSIVFRNP